jgi:hypothetical protein
VTRIPHWAPGPKARVRKSRAVTRNRGS